jgi:hypothetical protein
MRVRLTKRKGKKVFIREKIIPKGCAAYIEKQDFCRKAKNCEHIKDRTCPYLAIADRLAEYEDREFPEL